MRATTRGTGAGLGLATVRRLVEAHRGAVRLTSAPGEGTRVVIELPGDVAGPAVPPPSPRRDEGPVRGAQP